MQLYGIDNEEEAIEHMYKIYSREVSNGQSQILKPEEDPIFRSIN